MIPSPWVALVLGLAAYRLTRLVGWDDLPPIQKLRDLALGPIVVRRSAQQVVEGLDPEYATYRRPLLAHFVHCAFCQGFWVSVAVYLAWLGEPTWTLYGAFPLALAAFAGLVAKNLDP